jgi:drug/metabolite transporter (DMT)-like permease
MIQKLGNNKKVLFYGVMAALMVSILSSVDSSLTPLLKIDSIISSYASQQKYFITYSIVIISITEIFAVFVCGITINPRKLKSKFNTVRRSDLIKLFIGVLLGTALANLSYKLAIVYAGPGYGSILTNLYPVISIIGTIIIFKYRYVKSTYFWLATCVVVSTLFVAIPLIVEGSNFSWSKNGIGILFSFFAAFFWAVEGIVFRAILKNKNFEIDQQVFIFLRSLLSLSINLILFLPLSGLLTSAPFNPYPVFAKISSRPIVWIMGSIFGLLLFFVRKLHTFAIKTIGAGKTSVVDSTISLFSAIFSYIIYFATISIENVSKYYIDELVPWYVFLLIIPMIFALYMTITKSNIIPDNKVKKIERK